MVFQCPPRAFKLVNFRVCHSGKCLKARKSANKWLDIVRLRLRDYRYRFLLNCTAELFFISPLNDTS